MIINKINFRDKEIRGMEHELNADKSIKSNLITKLGHPCTHTKWESQIPIQNY